MAVHFCPALTVISLTTSAVNRSNSAVPGAAAGASTAALSESVSTLSRAARLVIAGWVHSAAAVAAEPVKAMLSWPLRQSSRPASSEGDAHSSCRDPSGISPDSMMSRTVASAR